MRTGEELAIDRFIAEAGHRTAIQSECARCDDQIGALESPVAEGMGVGESLLAGRCESLAKSGLCGNKVGINS